MNRAEKHLRCHAGTSITKADVRFGRAPMCPVASSQQWNKVAGPGAAD